MSDIHIERSHALGLAGAREAARRWIEQAEREYGLECDYQEGTEGDIVTFERSGVEGRLEVDAETLRVDVEFGFLMDVFSGPIEAKLTRHIDELLGSGSTTA